MGIFRTVAALVAVLACASSFAASVAERSPFAQGLWWDPARAGNGFEIFNAADTVQVLWYTFDDQGRPVWYTAQGPVGTIGREAWPLLHHRWLDGRKAEPTTVGSLRLNPSHPEGADVVWSVGGRQGSWTIQPFYTSGMIREVDHTGTWFDPANSGWGVSLVEQVDVLGGVLFTYDAAGAPTWVAGFDRGSTGSAAMHAATGSCPGCAPRATVTRPVGRLSFEFASETRLTVRTQLDFAMAAGVNANNASLIMLSRPASWRAADRQLASFATEAGLRDYLVAGMANIVPRTLIEFSPAPPSASYSTTNLQEQGVDEADLVKTNGRQVYAYAHDNAGNRVPAVRVARVEDEGGALVPAGSVALASGPATPMAESGLLLHGENLVSVTGTRPWGFINPPWVTNGAWMGGSTHVEVLGLADPQAPASRWRAEIEGHLISTRRIGSRLYVVSRFAPAIAGYVHGTTGATVMEANRRLLAEVPTSFLLPKVRVNGGAAAVAVTASSVFVPPQGARPPTAETTLVTAIDLDAPRIVQSLAIVGPVETVYASPANLYVASSRWSSRDSRGVLLPSEPSYYLSDIHQVRLGTDGMAIVGSASLEGYLSQEPDLAPFRMSEHAGRLRVVTSSTTMWGGSSRNRLTILEPSGISPGLLKTVSWLPNDRRPEPLGKPGELVYGTRFVGDRLYAVTFKMVDPLYVVDLSDAADPRIAGALEIPGFSEYLHPLPNGLLIGFGKDAVPATEMGDGTFSWYQGLQLALYDVSDARAPRQLQRVLVGKRGSDSALLRSHHAFSILRRADGSSTIAIPAAVHDGPIPYPGAAGPSTAYPWSYSGLLRFELRGTTAADARLVALLPLVTHGTSPYPYGPANDPGRDGGRSVLFTNGTIYSGNGQFWRGDEAGNVTGPY